MSLYQVAVRDTCERELAGDFASHSDAIAEVLRGAERNGDDVVQINCVSTRNDDGRVTLRLIVTTVNTETNQTNLVPLKGEEDDGKTVS